MNEPINPNAAGAAVASLLLILGYLVRAYIPALDKKYIPLILLVIGTPLQWYAQGGEASLWAWIGAFIWAAGPTGIHEAAKTGKKES